MHTENTEKELSVFSGCIFSVAGMCTGRTKISPYQSTLSNRFSRMSQSNFGIQAYLFRYREVSRQANYRYLDALAAVDDPKASVGRPASELRKA